MIRQGMFSSIKFSWVVYDFVSTFDEKKNFPKSSKGAMSWDPSKVNRCYQIILQIIIVYGLQFLCHPLLIPGNVQSPFYLTLSDES